MTSRFSILDQVDSLLEEEDGHYISEVLERGQPARPADPECPWCPHAEHGLVCAPLLDYAPEAQSLISYYETVESTREWYSCKCPSSFGPEPDPSLIPAKPDFPVGYTFVGTASTPWSWTDEITRWQESAARFSESFRQMSRTVSMTFSITASQVADIRREFGLTPSPSPAPTSTPVTQKKKNNPREYPEALQAALDARRGRNTGPVRASAQTAHRPRRHT